MDRLRGGGFCRLSHLRASLQFDIWENVSTTSWPCRKALIFPVPLFHHLKMQDASASKRRRTSVAARPSVRDRTTVASGRSTKRRRSSATVKLSSAQHGRSRRSNRTNSTAKTVMTWSDTDDQPVGALPTVRSRFRGPEEYQKGDVSCRSGGFETRAAPKSARL